MKRTTVHSLLTDYLEDPDSEQFARWRHAERSRRECIADGMRAELGSARYDAWQNQITGYGTARDKTTAQDFVWDLRLNDGLLEALYHGDDMCARAVDLLPTDALRQGFDLTIPGAPDVVQGLQDRFFELDSNDTGSLFRAAAIWGRLYGGAALFLGCDDGQEASKPLNEGRIKTFEWWRVIDKRDLIPQTWYSDPLHPRFGQPETFRVIVTPAAGGVVVTNAVIHESRLILFRGALTAMRIRRTNYGWDHSVIQKLWSVLQMFASVWQSAGALMSDVSQSVFKIQGLIQALAERDAEAIQTRMALIDSTRSAMRAVLLDAEHEDFARVATPITGVPELLHMAHQRLSAALDTPLTRLFGVSPGGLSATGESDLKLWHATIRNARNVYLAPRLRRLFSLLMRAKDGPTSGRVPAGWSLDWPSLWDMTPLEEAQVHTAQATADSSYINAGVVTAEEVGTSRFNGPAGWSLRTTIDHSAREALMASDHIQEELEAGGQPPPEVTPATGGVAGEEVREDYSPDQPRDAQGRFVSGTSASAPVPKPKAVKLTQMKAVELAHKVGKHAKAVGGMSSAHTQVVHDLALQHPTLSGHLWHAAVRGYTGQDVAAAKHEVKTAVAAAKVAKVADKVAALTAKLPVGALRQDLPSVRHIDSQSETYAARLQAMPSGADTVAAFQAYSSGHDYEIRALQRGVTPAALVKSRLAAGADTTEETARAHVDESIRHRAALEAAPTEHVSATLMRGMSVSSRTLAQILTHKTYDLGGMHTSFSGSKHTAENFAAGSKGRPDYRGEPIAHSVVLVVNGGVSAHPVSTSKLSQFDNLENEVLIPGRQKFRILRREYDTSTDMHIIHLQAK